MNSKILLLALTVAFLSSCTTAYKTGQTPDDVYYSAAQPQKEDDKVDKEDRRDNTYSDEYYDDRYLRMKVSNRYRWNDLNDWYSYDRYSFGYNYHYGSYYNPYNSWNYYYNPYCCCVGNNNNYSNPKVASIKPTVRPTSFNLGGYTNTNYNNTNSNGNSKSVRNNNNNGRSSSYNNSYNNTNSNGSSKGAGGVSRTIYESNNYNNNNSSSGSSNSSSNRTYTPSNNNSSSSSSSSGSSGSSSGGSSSGGSVTRPGRN